MSEDNLFQNLNSGFSELWESIKKLADELEIDNEDQQYFIADDSAKLSVYINSYANNIISVGAHLARVKGMKQRISDKAARVFGEAYVDKTNEGPPATVNVSKFDQEYRKGMALKNPEYIKLTKLLGKLVELECLLEAIKSSLNIKANVLPTMFKLEKDKF